MPRARSEVRERGRSLKIRRTKWRTVLLSVGLAVARLGFGPPDSWAQQPVGIVTQLSGAAQLKRSGVIQPIAQGTAVTLHDAVTTEINSALTITLADRSNVSLSQSTTLVINESVVAGGVRQTTTLGLLSGTVRSVVTSALRGAVPTYKVTTPNSVAGVRGTDFDVTYVEGAARPGYEGCRRYTDVAVRAGTVEVSNLSVPNAVVDVPEGYETTVPCLQPPLTPGPLGITGAAGSVSAFSAPPPGAGSAPPPVPNVTVQ